MNYDINKIEKKWQKYWKDTKIFETKKNQNKLKKYYILNMFPYPSGSGLHVGHLIGYIAADVYKRYKMSKGYNVLNPIGFDSFGLPTEHYSIINNKPPDIITKININTYKKQLKNIGLSFNWDTELYTSDSKYYKWTQMIFIKMFHYWFNKKTNKSEPIKNLVNYFKKKGSHKINEFAFGDCNIKFSNIEWLKKNHTEKEEILQHFRLVYKKKTLVNWCPKLNTVLANEEIKSGKSERGGYNVYKKYMLQWNLRTTAFIERLLKEYKNIDYPSSLKKTQVSWIGKVTGWNISLETNINKKIKIFIKNKFDISDIKFILISSDNNIMNIIINNIKNTYLNKIKKYIKEQDDKIDINNQKKKEIYTGVYAINPLNKQYIPIYLSNDIIHIYETTISLGMPKHNKHDYNFYQNIKHEILCINNKKKKQVSKNINNIVYKKNIKYNMRDAVFSRQRYWGEPIPIYYKNNIPCTIPIKYLPLKLPNIINNNFKSLKKINKWAWDIKKKKIVNKKLINQKTIFPLETDTMPSWAGSSWYYLRYIDNNNKYKIFSKKKENYWKNVDMYIGGKEHATGHLIYSRIYHKFLKDIGLVTTEEPFKKIINQGVILNKTYTLLKDIYSKKIISYKESLYNTNIHQTLYIKNHIIKKNNEVDIKKLLKWNPCIKKNDIILDDGKLLSKMSIEKMSKSKFNTINPDYIYKKYGADVLRIYEMFLGPFHHNKIWSLKHIKGSYNFLQKILSLFYKNSKLNIDTKNQPTLQELETLNVSIKKITENIEKFSFNTAISQLMILVKKTIKTNCRKIYILKIIIKLLNPFAPHISEEIWRKLGYNKSICLSKFPEYDKKIIQKKSFNYPVMINNKFKFKIKIKKYNKTNIENIIKKQYKKYINKKIKKIIIIPNKIINILL